MTATDNTTVTTPRDTIDQLARDLERLESARAVKNLQRSYSQYAQFGLWHEVGALFAEGATLKWGEETVSGREAIEAWLRQRGGGSDGLPSGGMNTELIDEPLLNLSVDGSSAQCRWMSLALRGDGNGHAWFEGGIYENTYELDGVWRISGVDYFPMYEGDYANGWRNVDGKDLPRFPFHFTIEESGIPVPEAVGPAPTSGASLAALEERIASLNDEDAVRNIQHAYGYYLDRRMWDDVVDLFSETCVVELGGREYRGRAGVRQAMETMGPSGLSHGVLNEHPLFDTIVRITPGGGEAQTRGIQLGLLGEADKGTASWQVNIFRNRFVKEDGLWKFRELRLSPTLDATYEEGWSQEGALHGSDKPNLPAFLTPNPVTGTAVDTLDFTVVMAEPLVLAAASTTRQSGGDLTEARRRLARSFAYDGTENISSAYGYYLDDFQWTELGLIMATKGNKQSPFAGYYLGRERIQTAATTMWGEPPLLRHGVAFHWRTQLVVHVSHDGRSANLRTRLFQPRCAKDPSDTPRGNYMGGMAGGMYPNDQTVLEDGSWRLWSLTIDEHYWSMPSWEGGWSGAKEPETADASRPSPLVEKYPPDILISDLGRREEGFRGGTGTTITWPGILPMWFHYRNPVSGRTPELFWPDCVPSEMLPEASMTKHGYQMPPNGPESDGIELR